MIQDHINQLIAKATFARDNTRMLTLRALKTELVKAKTEKNAKPLDEAREIQIVQKMVKQREESESMYSTAGRTELAANERAEIEILKEFLPAPVTADQIKAAVLNCGIELVKSNMGSIVKVVKGQLPGADGKLVADTVKTYLS